MFKKIFGLILSLSIIFSANLALANEKLPIIVNEKPINEFAISENNVELVPIRPVAQALGYTVIYYPEYQNISIEDNIQRAIVHENSTDVIFQGKLKIINLSRREQIDLPVQILSDGRAYVPAEFFSAFFNDVSVQGNKLLIDTRKAYADSNIVKLN